MDKESHGNVLRSSLLMISSIAFAGISGAVSRIAVAQGVNTAQGGWHGRSQPIVEMATEGDRPQSSDANTKTSITAPSRRSRSFHDLN